MLRVATIGTSFIVDAMYTRKRDHATHLAEKYQIPAIYTDLNEMLDDPMIDVVYIASPNSLHYVYAKQILNKGKHVICEKPFTSNLKQCEELFALAEEKGRFIFEAIKTIHMPNFKKIKSLLPALGTIKLVRSNFSRYSSQYENYENGIIPNCLNPDLSSGALADVGIYSVHFIVALFGMPQTLQYYPNLGPNGIDTSGIGILKYPDFVASVTCAKDSDSTLLTEIQGTKGTISVHSQPSKVAQFTYQDTKTKQVQDLSIQQHPVSLFEELQDFVKIINNDDHLEYEALKQETYLAMKVFEELRKSAGIRYQDDL